MIVEHGQEWPYIWRLGRVRILLAFMYLRRLGLRCLLPHFQIVRCYSRIPYVVFGLLGVEVTVYGLLSDPPWPGFLKDLRG